jgi:hypothetical protein
MQEFMSTREAAAEIGVSEQYAKRLATEANLNVPKMGPPGRRRYWIWNPSLVLKCKEIVDSKRKART